MAKYDDPDDGAFEERPRPLRRRRIAEDDYDEDLPRVPRQQNRLRRQLSQTFLVLLACLPLCWGMIALVFGTSLVLLVLFSLCCGMIALILGIIGVAVCHHPKARQNAMIVLVISIGWILVGGFFFLVENVGMIHEHHGQGLFR